MSSAMSNFFIPGPTWVRPEILQEMTRPMIGHRSAEFKELFQKIVADLKPLFATQQDTFVATCSGTGLMQAALANCVPRRVLATTCGAFSEKWANIAESLGLHVNTVRPHLERMRDVGLLEVQSDNRGSVGRPQHRYLLAADWLVNELRPNAQGVAVWQHPFDWEYREVLKAGWYSALAQGQGVSLLCRAYRDTGRDIVERLLRLPAFQRGLLAGQ